MTILISGRLKDAFSRPLAHVNVKFGSLRTNLNTISGTTTQFKTDNDGLYSVEVASGTYSVEVDFGGSGFSRVGEIQVAMDSLPGSLEEFLTIPGVSEITPEILAQVLQARKDAIEAAGNAASDATNIIMQQLQQQQSDFDNFLLSSGYVFLGDYDGGPFQFSARNQYIRYGNQYYRLNAATDVGFTTTGTDATSFANDVTHFVLMDGDTLRQNLGSDEDGMGDALIAHRRRTVRERLDDEVSVLDHGSPDKFGTAMMAAMDYVMSQGGGTIFVPGRSYTLDTTIKKTLTTDIHIRMSKGADVAVKSPIDVYDLNTGNYQFVVEGGKTTVSLPALGVGLAVFRITGKTLQQTCRIAGHTLRKTGTNNIGHFVYAVGANAPEFMHNHISAASIAYHLESSTENSSSGLIANAMEAEISSNKVYNCSVAVEIVNKGYYGCEGVIIAFNKFVCGDTAIRVVADASLRSAYMPPLMQVISNHLNAYKAITAQKISRLFFSKNDIQSKFRADDTVSGMIELYSCQGWSIVDNEFAAVSQDGSGRSNTNTPIFLGEMDSVLPNAYGTISNNTFWLDNMTAKAINMSSAASYGGKRIKYGLNTLQSLSAITSRAYGSKLKISEENELSTYDVSEGLAYSSSDANYTFDSALGILYIKGAAPARDLHIIGTNVVPNGVTINQMVAENTFGKQLVIQFVAAEVTLTHGANLIAPDQKTTKMWLPAFVVAEFMNSQQCRIVSISGISARHVISNPAPGATGSTGDQYYDPATGIWKVFMPGGGFRLITTSPNT